MSTTIEAARPMLIVGEIMGTLGIPALGLVLLIVGIIQRGRSSTATPPYPYPPQAPPGYPPTSYPPQSYPPTGYAPPGYPPQGYPQQGYPPQQFGQPVPQPGPYPYQPPATKRGTALMVIGGLLLAFGLLGIVGRVATHDSGPHRSAGMAPTSIATP